MKFQSRTEPGKWSRDPFSDFCHVVSMSTFEIHEAAHLMTRPMSAFDGRDDS